MISRVFFLLILVHPTLFALANLQIAAFLYRDLKPLGAGLTATVPYYLLSPPTLTCFLSMLVVCSKVFRLVSILPALPRSLSASALDPCFQLLPSPTLIFCVSRLSFLLAPIHQYLRLVSRMFSLLLFSFSPTLAYFPKDSCRLLEFSFLRTSCELACSCPCNCALFWFEILYLYLFGLTHNSLP